MIFENIAVQLIILITLIPIAFTQGIIYQYTANDYYAAFNELPVVIPFSNGTTLNSFTYTDPTLKINITYYNLYVSSLTFAYGNYSAQLNSSNNLLTAIGSKISMGISFHYNCSLGNGYGIAVTNTSDLVYRKTINYTQGVLNCNISLNANWTNITVSTLSGNLPQLKKSLSQGLNEKYGQIVGSEVLQFIEEGVNENYVINVLNPNYFEGYIPSEELSIWYYNYQNIAYMDSHSIIIGTNGSLTYPYDGPVIPGYTTKNVLTTFPFAKNHTQVCITKEFANLFLNYVLNGTYMNFVFTASNLPLQGFNYTVAQVSEILPALIEENPREAGIWFWCNDLPSLTKLELVPNVNELAIDHALQCECISETNSSLFQFSFSTTFYYDLSFPKNETSTTSVITDYTLNGYPTMANVNLNITQQAILTHYTEVFLNGLIGSNTQLGSHFGISLVNGTFQMLSQYILINGTIVLPEVSAFSDLMNPYSLMMD